MGARADRQKLEALVHKHKNVRVDVYDLCRQLDALKPDDPPPDEEPPENPAAWANAELPVRALSSLLDVPLSEPRLGIELLAPLSMLP